MIYSLKTLCASVIKDNEIEYTIGNEVNQDCCDYLDTFPKNVNKCLDEDFYSACESGSVGLVEEIFKLKTNVHLYGHACLEFSLYASLRYGNVNIAQLIIENVKIEYTTLFHPFLIFSTLDNRSESMPLRSIEFIYKYFCHDYINNRIYPDFVKEYIDKINSKVEESSSEEYKKIHKTYFPKSTF